MRVLLLTQFYPPVIGGEERHVRNLGVALAARGHSVAVATQATRGMARTEMDGAVRVHRLRGTLQRFSALHTDPERPHAPPIPDPELTLGLRRVITQEKPDVVHAHNWLLHSFLPLRPFTRASFVVTLHDYALVCARKSFMHLGERPCSGPGLFKCLNCASQYYGGVKGCITTLSNWLDGAYERHAVDMFLAVSSAVARFNGLPASGVPYEVVPNFVPDTISTLSPDVDAGLLATLPERFILFVGDLHPRKGILLLLEAYQRLSAPPPLVLIGRRLAETPATLPTGVHLIDSWPHAAIMHAWNLCLFGVAPSLWHEPCATVVLEAMGQGKPMVVTNMGGMPEMVADGETGLVVPPEIAALAAALDRLRGEAALRDQMGAAALTRVALFQERTVVSRIEAIYRDLAAQRVRGPAE